MISASLCPVQQHRLDLPRLVGQTRCPGLPLPAGAVRWPRPYLARAKGLAVDLLLCRRKLESRVYLKSKALAKPRGRPVSTSKKMSDGS
ncbi:unnamed protein product [Prunus armeniaca]